MIVDQRSDFSGKKLNSMLLYPQAYNRFFGGGPSTDAMETKSAVRRGQAALLLKFALDVPLYGEEGVRTSESEQELTLRNYE